MLFKEFSDIYEQMPSFLILLVSCSPESNHEIKTWIRVLYLGLIQKNKNECIGKIILEERKSQYRVC